MSWKPIVEDRLERTGHLAGNEAVVKLYLTRQLNHLATGLARHIAESDRSHLKQTVAAEIAELRNLAAFRALDADNPYLKIVHMAEQLARPSAAADESASWDALQQLIQSLPVNTRERVGEQLKNAGQISGSEQLLKQYFEEEIARRNQYPELERDVAYDITGLMSAEAFRGVDHSDPYMQILGMAGELELPPAHRDESATWDNLIEVVHALP